MVVVSFYLPSLTPSPPTVLVSLASSPSPCDTTVFPPSGIARPYLCQAEVRFQTRPLVHPPPFYPFDPSNGGPKASSKEGFDQAVEKSSCVDRLLPRTHGMVSPSIIVLVPYTFSRGTGPYGGFYFSCQLPRPSSLVEPIFHFGCWQYQYAPSLTSSVLFPPPPLCVLPQNARAI